MPFLTNIANGNSISFSEIATQASLGLSNVTMLQLAQNYTGVDDVGEIPICEFYSNGCAGVIPTTPTGFTAVLQSGLVFNLAWNAVAYATSYKIYRAGVYYSTVTGISTQANATGFGVNTCWSVLASNANGNSAQTAQICGMSGSPSYNSINLNSGVFSNAVDACNQTASTQKYTNGSATLPNVGDKIYNDSSGSSLFNGISGWWKFNTGYSVEISGVGVITNVAVC